MNIDISKVGIKFKHLDDKKTKAIIALTFGEITIRGFRITESQYENRNGEKLWLIPPSYQAGGRYHPMFYLVNEEKWLALEKRIWTEFKESLDDYHKKKYAIEEEF